MQEGIFPTYFVPLYLGLVFEIWGSSLFLLAGLNRRRLWGLRIACGSLFMIGLAIALGFLRNLAPDLISMRMLCSFLLYGSTLGFMFLCFDEKPIDILLTWVSIMAIREAADGVDTLVRLAFGVPTNIIGYLPDANFFVNGLIFDVAHLTVQLPLGFLFMRYKSSTKDRTIILRTVALSSSLMLFTIVIKAVITSHSGESLPLFASATALTLLLSVFTLLARTDALIGSQKSQELAIMQAVLDSQEKQFEESKLSIGLINEKVHDIRHHLDDFGDKVAEETLNQLKSSIEIYDRPFHTGSQVLDTILYTKSLSCDSLGIRLTAIGDAKPLHFIPSSKRYYLFSNIIDNAIEAAREVEDMEKRVIGLSLRRQGDYFEIEEYNYFSGKRIIENGEMCTTKKDSRGHGLGLKSIRAFAEEYGGSMEMTINDDMFFLLLRIRIG